MKKFVKIFLGIICGVVVLSIGGCTALLGIANERNNNYYKYSTPVGEIEKKYTQFGEFEVSYKEFDAKNDSYKKYEVWFPSSIESEDTKYPVVIIANGTGTKASSYKSVFKHLASYGFIVAGNEDENSKTGDSSSKTLDYLLKLNENSNSEFFHKIDTENIGIAGHSQGGVGAINAVTNQGNGNMYKAIFTASATSRYHADELNKNGEGWSVDISKINIPTFMVAGTGVFDAGNLNEWTTTVEEGQAQGICPLWWLNECYDAIPNGVTKIIARMGNKDHGDMLRAPDAYMTAWFMYYLKGETTSNFFTGVNAEIVSNSNYQDVKIG